MVVAAKTQKMISKDVTVHGTEIRPESADEIPAFTLAEWKPRAEIVVQGPKSKKYLTQEAMKDFLGQLQDNQIFQFRGLHTTKDFSTQEYYLIRQWLLIRNLAEKVAGGYKIKSIEAVRRIWNSEILEAVKI